MDTGRADQATIFLIEEDDDTRPLLRKNLKGYGYRVIVSVDEEDALERVGGGHVQADLVLINLVGKSTEEVLTMGRRIRAHMQYDGHTPLVVLAEKYGPELEGTNVHAGGNDWIAYLEDHDQLQNLIARLLDRSST